MQGTINQGEAVGSSAPAHFYYLSINSIGSRGVSELNLASLQFHNYNYNHNPYSDSGVRVRDGDSALAIDGCRRGMTEAGSRVNGLVK